MNFNLYLEQLNAIDKLDSGKILCGGVGTGKSRTSLAYFYFKECQGKIPVNGEGVHIAPKNPKNLIVITTAKKRNSKEWEEEALPFMLSKETNPYSMKMTVDSWNNIKKYETLDNCFFIFDEQKLVGYGSWVKSFLKIVKRNRWILLSATPGDRWIDYCPIFIANGFYRNKTEFTSEHVEYNPYVSFPSIKRYHNISKLRNLEKQILVDIPYKKHTVRHEENIYVAYDGNKVRTCIKNRWNEFTQQPIQNASEMFYTIRRIINSDVSRLEAIEKLFNTHKKIIIFYNYNYELEMLKELKLNTTIREYNGKKHEEIPNTDTWLYLVQYNSSEGWNCTKTDTIIFYSLNYSYRTIEQGMGRIDRANTPYKNLYYYMLISNSDEDKSILRTVKNKQKFNKRKYIERYKM